MTAPLARGAAPSDLGPAWFWPGQPRIAALLETLGIAAFPQHATGKLACQEADGAVRRDLDFATMADALRVSGGLGAVTRALTDRLDPERLTLDAPVTQLRRTAEGVRVETPAGPISARRVALALPPRQAAEIVFAPALSETTQRSWAATPTWMAGHAKALAVYDRPFWREAGLSGDAISRRGPLAEIHDASPEAASGAGALFGFFGLPAEIRAAHRDQLADAVVAQLTDLFGPKAAQPVDLAILDWAEEPFTATRADRAPLAAHPEYGAPALRETHWDGRLALAGSETDPVFGGFVEGALAAADRVADAFLAAPTAPSEA